MPDLLDKKLGKKDLLARRLEQQELLTLPEDWQPEIPWIEPAAVADPSGAPVERPSPVAERSQLAQMGAEIPENLRIGAIGLAANLLSAIKRRAMQLSGGGAVPDEVLRHQYEAVTPQRQQRPTIFGEPPRLPGAIAGEAAGVVTRLPDIGSKILGAKQQELAARQEQVSMENKPLIHLSRLVMQSGVPSVGAAIGASLLTGDPLVGLLILGETEGGGAFESQLEAGASVLKANIIGELSEAAEIGGEMLVFPKFIRGLKEGIPFQQALRLIAENATQEGVTGFAQRFLEVIGKETTKGTPVQDAAVKAFDEGVKAIPENAFVGGATAGLIDIPGTAVRIAKTPPKAKHPEPFTVQPLLDELRAEGRLAREQRERRKEAEARDEAEIAAMDAELAELRRLARKAKPPAREADAEPTPLAEAKKKPEAPPSTPEKQLEPLREAEKPAEAEIEKAEKKEAEEKPAEETRAAEFTARMEKPAELQKEVEQREAESELETTGVSKRRRNRIIRETEKNIAESDLYKEEVAAIERMGREVDVGFYHVPENLRAEVEDIIGEVRGFPTKLQKMFTFDPTEEGARPWDTALQEALGIEDEQGRYDTHAEMDITDFVWRVKEAAEAQDKWGKLNARAIENLRNNGDPWTQYKIAKLEMLREGQSPETIDEMTADFAEAHELDPEMLDTEWVGAEPLKLKQIKTIEDPEEQERQLEVLARELVLKEEREQAKTAVKDVLRANGLEDAVEVRKTERIEEPKLIPKTVTRADTKRIAALRKSGDSLTKQIEQKRHPAIADQAVTRRRANIAAGMAKEADYLERQQQALYAIADAIEKGIVPATLENVKSRTDVEAIQRGYFSLPDMHRSHYNDLLEKTKGMKGSREAKENLRGLVTTENRATFSTDTQVQAIEKLLRLAESKGVNTRWMKDGIAEGKRFIRLGIKNKTELEQAKADLEALLKPKPKTAPKEIEIREKTHALIGRKIPGFFPTPKGIVEQMVELADIEPGMSVLEPSAGKGDIADVIREKHPDAELNTIEYQTELAEILKLKGHPVIVGDFLEHRERHDRIIMNPPFEKGQDIDHVRHAYEQLEPGGRLVSVMSPGPFFKTDKKSQAFREWLDTTSWWMEQLPEGAFKGKEAFRQTGVASRLVVIDKEVLGDEMPFERRGGEPVGAAFITPAGQEIVLLAYGADSATGYHEAYHVLRRRLTNKDVAALNKIFRGDQEAEADAFAEYAKTGKAKASVLKSIWEKLVKVLRKIKSTLQGMGYRTAQDIFAELAAGDYAFAARRGGPLFDLHYERKKADAIRGVRTPEGSAITSISEAVTDPRLQQALPPQTEPPRTLTGSRKTPAGFSIIYADEFERQQVSEKNFEPENGGKYATGDVVTGDVICFSEAVFRGSYRKPKYLGDRTIIAEVLKDSYGAGKQQHTFTINVIKSRGYEPLKTGVKTRRKGRNVYRQGTQRLPWRDEAKREEIAGEKHERGDAARRERDKRRELEAEYDVRFKRRKLNRSERIVADAERAARVRAKKERLKKMAGLTKKAKKMRGRIQINIREVTPVLSKEMGQAEGARRPAPPGETLTAKPEQTRYLGPEFKPDEPLESKFIEAAEAKRRELSDEWYKQNIKKTTADYMGKARRAGRSAWTGAEKIFAASSTRLYNIHPVLFREVRRYAYDVLNRTTDMLNDIKPFLKAVKKMSKKDRAELDLALKNAHHRKIGELIAKYGLEQEYAEARDVLDEIYSLAKEVGIEIDYRRDYWHRHLNDPAGFLEYFQKGENWSLIEQAIKSRAQRSGRKVEELTVEEKAKIVNTLLRGYRTQALVLSRPGAAKERTIDIIDRDLNQFYDDFANSITRYIKLMNAKVAEREFFGSETKEIVNLRRLQSQRLTRLIKLQRRQGLKEGATETKYKEHISKTWETYQADQERLQRLATRSPAETIGGYVFELQQQGHIQPSQEQELQGILQGIFNPRGMSRLGGLFSTGIYLDVLNSPLQALTQVEEFVYSFYCAPLKSIPVAIRTTLRRSKVTPEDIGIHSIGEEFRGPSMRRALSTMLRATGFEQIDRLNKENYINTALADLQAQARKKKPSATFHKRLARVFGGEYKQVVEDLRKPIRGIEDASDNVKYLLFNQLLDIQPIAITEMPEAYNKGGNLRLLYTLKTFYMRRLDFIRNECLKDMKSRKTFVRGFSNLVWLAFCMALMGAGVDAIKDFIRGRKFDLSDSVADTLLKCVFLSKYSLYRARTEGAGRAVMERVFPPTKAIDELSKDIQTIAKGKDRGFELWRSVPVVGELYYWWFGRGKEKTEKQKKKKRKTWAD